MFRWAVTGAVFSVGMAAGVLASYQFMPSGNTTPVKPARVAENITPTPAAAVRPVKPEVQPVPEAVEPLIVTSLDADTEVRASSELPAFTKHKFTDSVSISNTASNGEASSFEMPVSMQQRPVKIAPVKIAPVKIAKVSTSHSALGDNPIVVRELARDIQRELYRAGCYSVVISGKWDGRTAKAAARFIANRNAVLPSDKPDVILLSMLRSYEGAACGGTCASASGSDNACAQPQIVANRTPHGSVSIPPAVHASVPSSASTYASGGIAPSAPRVQPAPRTPAQNSARPVLRPASKPRAVQSASAVRKPRKNKISWRHQVHYGRTD